MILLKYTVIVVNKLNKLDLFKVIKMYKFEFNTSYYGNKLYLELVNVSFVSSQFMLLLCNT